MVDVGVVEYINISTVNYFKTTQYNISHHIRCIPCAVRLGRCLQTPNERMCPSLATRRHRHRLCLRRYLSLFCGNPQMPFDLRKLEMMRQPKNTVRYRVHCADYVLYKLVRYLQWQLSFRRWRFRGSVMGKRCCCSTWYIHNRYSERNDRRVIPRAQTKPVSFWLWCFANLILLLENY